MLLVRHGESHFNVHFSKTRIDPGIADPGLTRRGLEQAVAAADRIAALGRAKRIITSPYWRTLQTAEIIADRLGLPVSIETQVRERAFFACDMGTPRHKLAARWPQFEFVGLTDTWWPNLDETVEQLDRRSAAFRRQLAEAGDWQGLLVVTHWGFIRALTGETVENGTVLGFDPTSGSVEIHETAA
ncbi:MAG TPA: histidine phosphatase family protein [Kiloniellaceae bacterium]|nr:histidine phosphatase family protein [Kiloniellaceae bacterium]